MTHWFPSNKNIIKVFLFNFLGWTLLAILNNVLTFLESFALGFGMSILFLLLYIFQIWNNENIRKSLLKTYLNSNLVSSQHWKVVNNSELIGQVNGFDVKLTPVVDESSITRFNVEVNLDNKQHLNINRAFGKIKYTIDGTILSIPNWSPKLWSYRKLEKVISKLQELLNKLENA